MEQDAQPTVARSPQTPGLFRSKLGNWMLVANVALIVRGLLLNLAVGTTSWSFGPAYFASRTDEFGHFSPAYELYNVVHSPTWVVLLLLGWAYQPALQLLPFGAIVPLRNAAFVVVSSFQWLVTGYCIERLLQAGLLDFADPRPLSIMPTREPFTRADFARASEHDDPQRVLGLAEPIVSGDFPRPAHSTTSMP